MKVVLAIAGFVAFLYALAWAPAVFGWVFRAIVVYVAWKLASSAFRTTRTPWRTSLRAAAVIVGLAAVGAVRLGEPSCDEDGECDYYEGPPITASDRAASFLTVVLLLGAPTGIAAWRQRHRFPDPDAKL